MKYLVTLTLTLLTMLCSYIILHVGLGWLWPIGNCENADNVNQVLLNLSYSYMAGLIFYLLVNYLPNYLKKRKVLPSIRLKIEDLYKQINACIQTFESTDRADLLDTITHERIINLINGADMYGQSFYARMVGYDMNNLKFLVATKETIFTLIDQIVGYKEFLSGDQLLEIEKIHDSTYFHLIKIYEDSPTARLYYSHQRFKDEMIKDFIPVMLSIKELRRSLKVKVSFES